MKSGGDSIPILYTYMNNPENGLGKHIIVKPINLSFHSKSEISEMWYLSYSSINVYKILIYFCTFNKKSIIFQSQYSFLCFFIFL